MAERTFEEVSLTEVAVRDPSDQSELIAQLIQQIADMRAEMQRNSDLTNLAISSNLPPLDIRRPPPHFPTLNSPAPEHFPPLSTALPTSIIKTTPIKLTTSDPCTSYHTPPPNVPHNIHFQDLPSIHDAPLMFPQIPSTAHNQLNTPIATIQNPVVTSAYIPPATSFQVHTIPEPYATLGAQPELDHYEDKEREWREKEEKRDQEMQAMKDVVARAMKDLQFSQNTIGLDYEDLCMHPDLDLPEGYKIPKFETFDGIGNPMAHLRAYCDKLVGVGRNEALIMRLFSRSLSGEALEWFTTQELSQWPSWRALAKDFIERFSFNMEVVPDRYSLEKIKQKSSENYREYASRWRKEAARVRPPMSEKEIVDVFLRTQEPEYYERMLTLIGQKFCELVKIGEAIEDGLKTGKIASRGTQVNTSGFPRKKKEDVSSISYHPASQYRGGSGSSSTARYPNQFSPLNNYPPAPYNPYSIFYAQPNFQPPPQTHSNFPPNYRAPTPMRPPPQNYGRAATSSYSHAPQNHSNNYTPPRSNPDKRPVRTFTPLAESRTQLFERLKTAGLIQPIDSKFISTNSRFYRADQYCSYRSGGTGHSTEECLSLKHKIQDLIDQKVISLQTAPPNVNSNPLPDHGETNIRMIEREEDWEVSKALVQNDLSTLEQAVASLSISRKPEFVVMTAPHQAFALVNKEVKSKFVVQAATTQGITRSGRCYIPEELSRGTQHKETQKRPITEGEAEEFWRRMQLKEYSIAEHLKKTSAQISVWALLMSSQYHRQALLKVLDEAYVPTGTSGENLGGSFGV